MTRRRILAYVACALLSWPVLTGIFYHDVQAIALKYCYDEHGCKWAAEASRKDLGQAVLLGAAFAAIWPVGLPMAWCLTGFAEHGVFSQAVGR